MNKYEKIKIILDNECNEERLNQGWDRVIRTVMLRKTVMLKKRGNYSYFLFFLSKFGNSHF